MKGDFLGFSFNTGGKHYTSEELGIIRVSDGDRYRDNLIPEIEDKTVEIPGMDGVYFYGSNFKSRTFSLSIAFDSITEEQLRKIRQAFGYKHTGELIFEEAPYKKYMVKVASPPELNYVCFDERKTTLVNFDGIKGPTTINQKEEETERIYKGDGTIELIAYYPFAKQVAKIKSEYDQYDNIDEWWAASGLLDSYEGIDAYSAGAFNVYNPGDIETGFRLYIPFVNNEIPRIVLTYKQVVGNIEKTLDTLVIENIIKPSDDESLGIQINTVNGLVEGVYKENNQQILPSDMSNSIVTSGSIFNRYAIGNFFKLQPQTIEEKNDYKIEIAGLDDVTPLIYYDYLYF